MSGVKGQKWGVRRYQDENGKLTPLGIQHQKDMGWWSPIKVNSQSKLFVSGTAKFEGELSPEVKSYLKHWMKNNGQILVGDCVGADTAVQQFLFDSGYDRVRVYVTDDEVRNNVGNWKVNHISGNGYEKGSREWHAEKDKAMTKDSTRGLSIWNGESRATGANIDRAREKGKQVDVYNYVDQTMNWDDRRRKPAGTK